MCERRIEIILERFEVKIDGNSCKNRSMLHIGGGLGSLYEARSQIHTGISYIIPLFEDLRAHMSESVET